MPDERFLHKRLGHSEKVNALNDLEFRVWTQYQLSADDCGVMRNAAIAIQADNDSLAARPAKAIQKALDKIVAVGLLLSFEHQGKRYVCQGDWQQFQKVRYPRSTVHPAPPAEVLAQCTKETRALFQIRHGETSATSPESSGDVSESSPLPTRAGAREEANGLRLTANGSERSAPQIEVKPTNGHSLKPSEPDELGMRAGRFCERYAELHAKFRKGARLVSRPAFRSGLGGGNLDFQEALSLVSTWDDERLDKLAQAFLTVEDDDWINSGPRTIARFRSRASWCDDRLREAGL